MLHAIIHSYNNDDLFNRFIKVTYRLYRQKCELIHLEMKIKRQEYISEDVDADVESKKAEVMLLEKEREAQMNDIRGALGNDEVAEAWFDLFSVFRVCDDIRIKSAEIVVEFALRNKTGIEILTD